MMMMMMIIGVWDQFRLGELRSVAQIFLSIACPKIKWFCPNITLFFAREWLFETFQGGCSPPPPTLYVYDDDDDDDANSNNDADSANDYDDEDGDDNRNDNIIHNADDW